LIEIPIKIGIVIVIVIGKYRDDDNSAQRIP
jgi:hypothetical protein